MDDLKNQVDKDIVKEAIKEWMDEQIKKFGWFSFKTVLLLAAGGLVYLAFIGTGHFR